MNHPLVTIGAINYNNATYVLETLESIAGQSYSNLELIIVDDASTDDSLIKIKEWLTRNRVSARLVIHDQNKGVHQAYESVIQYASGEFISFVATDDLLEPYKIEEQVTIFQQLDNSYGVVYGDVVEIDQYSNIINLPYFRVHEARDKRWKLPQGDIFKKVSKEFLIYVQATLIRTSVLKKFSFRFQALSEDWQLIIFLSRHCKFFGADKVVARYRRHPVSLSTLNRRLEKYHLWCQSNALMFYEAYNFPQNTKEERRIIANRIEFDMLDYACQPVSKGKDVIRTWKRVTPGMPLYKSAKILFMILWLRLKLLIKHFVFPKSRPKRLAMQN